MEQRSSSSSPPATATVRAPPPPPPPSLPLTLRLPRTILRAAKTCRKAPAGSYSSNDPAAPHGTPAPAPYPISVVSGAAEHVVGSAEAAFEERRSGWSGWRGARREGRRGPCHRDGGGCADAGIPWSRSPWVRLPCPSPVLLRLTSAAPAVRRSGESRGAEARGCASPVPAPPLRARVQAPAEKLLPQLRRLRDPRRPRGAPSAFTSRRGDGDSAAALRRGAPGGGRPRRRGAPRALREPNRGREGAGRGTEAHVRIAEIDRYGLVLRRSIAEAPADINVTTNSSFILAEGRTYRKDPLNGFRKYTGGWNISEVHYWASVGYTAAPLFSIALVWFVLFFLVMLGICCHHCCCPHRSYKYSRTAYALSLILLILFTCAAIVGCIVLYDGQGKFHSSTTTTLKFVVSQSDFTVDNLRNLSDSLSAAKKVDIGQFLLPPDVMTQINDIQVKLNSSATNLSTRTADNSEKIQKLLNRVRLALIIVAAVMLLLAFIGFLLSIFGLEFLVSVFVVIGWILVTATFILCGVFLLLHNVVADSCVSMEEWVAHPTEHTALDDIIPCVEPATANESLYQTRQVTSQLVNLVNQVITNVTNRNFPAGATPFYYNQSGPLMPTLCNPFTPDLNNRTCATGEVSLDKANQVWKSYECQTKRVSGADICMTVGRVTPRILGQMAAGVNVSQGLYQYGPFLTQLQDCTFVRDTFTTINQNYCPGLDRYSKWVYIGLVMVSAAVMLSLIFWVIYARERRHRVYSKQHVADHNY